MKIKVLLAWLLLSSALLCAQGTRYGDVSPLWTTTSTNGTNVLLTPVSGGIIHFCSSPANATPCTNYATTYTDATLTVGCSNSTQVVLAGTSICVAAADTSGNWGVWVPAGQYAYTVTNGAVSFGPFPVSVSPGPDSSGNFIFPQLLQAKKIESIVQADQYGVGSTGLTAATGALP